MNIKTCVLGLVCGLSIILSSCKKEDQILGIDVLQPSDILTTCVDSVSTTISFSTLKDDSIRSEYITYMVGENYDDVFGKSRAGYATRMYLQGMMGDLTGFKLDSVCLRLSKSAKYAYGDTNVAQTFSVYELLQDITVDDCAKYNQKAEIPSFVANKKKIFDVNVPAYCDTVSSYVFKFDADYGKELYAKLLQNYNTDTTLKYFDSLFIKQFKGLYITTKDDQFNQVQAVITHCVPEINFYVSGSDTTKKLVFAPSPQAYTSPVSNDPSQIYLQAINVFEHEYPSELASAIGTSTTQSYVQGMVGLKTKLTLSGLETWRDSLVAINVAKLSIPLQERTTWSEYLPLNLRIYDSKRNMVYSTMSTIADSSKFEFNVHPFLVHLFNNSPKAETYDYEVVVPENNTYNNAFVLDGTQTEKLKLVITYTK